jgi:hypothetical protein
MITTGFALARQLDPHRATVSSLHLATYMPTKMVLDSVGCSIDCLETGLQATLRLVLAPELDGVTGQFYDHTRAARAHAAAYDPSIQQKPGTSAPDSPSALNDPRRPNGTARHPVGATNLMARHI